MRQTITITRTERLIVTVDVFDAMSTGLIEATSNARKLGAVLPGTLESHSVSPWRHVKSVCDEPLDGTRRTKPAPRKRR